MRRSSRKSTSAAQANTPTTDLANSPNTSAQDQLIPADSDPLTSTSASHSTTATSSAKSKRKRVDDDLPSAATPANTASSSVNARPKRKSVTFEELEEAPVASTSRSTRSRRSSAASSTFAAQQPSAKSLGKRRAVSPSLHDPTPSAPAPASSSQPSKRRKVSHSTTPTDPKSSAEKDYNLRSRQPTTTAPSASKSSPKKKGKSSTSNSSAPSAASNNNPMPRKGSRASRAAKAKARAYEDGDDEHTLDLAGLGADGDVNMTDVAETSASAKKHEATAHHEAADDDDDDDDDDDEDDNSRSDSGSDSEEDDEGEGHYDEDEDEEEYETSLRADGSAHGDHDHDGYHSGGGDSDLIDPPQTFDADGSPLGTNSSLLDQAGLDAADAAEAAALFGGGGAFRALQGMMSGMSGRLKGLLQSLKQKGGDPSAKLMALQDLAELLSVSTEDTLSGYFQVEAFVKELISILRGDSNTGGSGGGSGLTEEEMMAFGMDPVEHGAGGGSEENDVQMMLLACRCLANLMEALPGSAHSVVYAGAVPVLCSKLLEIQYIDLAEQTLSTLEKISEEVPSSIVREGGLGALLTFLDFFSFHVQRTAVTAAANCCRSLALDSFSMVQDGIPIFKNILGYPDQRVVEQGCLAVVRIVDSYRHYPEKLEALLTSDLLTAIRALLNPDSTTVGPNTYTQTLKMLSTASKASPGVAITLVDLNIANTLYHLLTGVAAPEFPTDEGYQVLPKSQREGDDMLVMQTLVQRPKEQIQETLNLICELLPPLPKDGIFDSRAFSGKERSSRSSGKDKVKREEVTPDLGAALAESAAGPVASSSNADLSADVKMEAADDLPPPIPSPVLGSSSNSRSASRAGKSRVVAKEAIVEKRLELLKEGPESRRLVVNRLYALLLPILVDVCAASVNSQVRSKAVLGLLKIVNFCEKEPLAEILHTVSMASFLAAILSSRDQGPLVTNALQLVELLLVKMPDAYQYFFRREGVMHEIEEIASAALVTPPKSKKSSPSRTPRNAADLNSDAGPSDLSRALEQHADSTSPLTPAEAQAQDMITLRARHLRDDYGSADSEPALRARAALDTIEELVTKLDAFAEPSGKGPKFEKEVADVVEKVSKLFSDEKEPLSSFELLESGLVDGLLRFATETGTPTLTAQRRQELLAAAFMPHLDSGTSTPAFGLLVKRLQESLSRMEEFEVQLAAQNSTDAESRRNGPSMLARQLKLRLVAEEGSEIPRSCTNIVVSIHAIATFQAFNDYLRPRILAATSLADRLGSGSGAGAGRLSGFLAAFAAANGASPPSPESSSGTNVAGGSRLSSSLGAALAAAEEAEAYAEASTSTGAGASGKQSPTRRRSRRLSGKGLEGEGAEASSSKTPLNAEPAAAAPEDDSKDDGEDDFCEDDERDDDGDLFAGGFDASPPSRDERPVNLEVADDGSKVVAKTPDGTRVATPTIAGSSSRPPPAPKPRASYAAAVKTEPSDFHLEFSMGDRDVDLDTTVYGAVHNHDLKTPGANRRNMWHSIYEVRFRKVEGPARPEVDYASPEPTSRDNETILTRMPASIPADSRQAKILQLLWVLHRLNSEYADTGELGSTALADGSFVNNKLTAKLNRQLEEPMIVASACLPEWATDLPVHFPFLFPFDTRYTFLQSTAFGYARLMQKWVGQTRTDNSRRDDNLGFLGRLQRQKVRISRDRMLESAFKVFELYGSSRASLEVEFFSEVGSGLGPTLEFYALVSKEFARAELSIWRHGDSSDSAFVHNAAGLFPAPLDDATTEAGKKALKVFRVLGQFVAKSMMDSRIIDVHFSRAFMRLVLDQELPLTIAAVKTVDKNLGFSLAHLQELIDSKHALENDESKTDAEHQAELAKITSTVNDLTLDFTLPGYDVALKDGGQDIAVDTSNLEEYIALVIDWTLRKGVMLQLKEFRSGFSAVFPVRDLQSFTPAELVMLTGALDEDWTIEGLTNAVKADHGFTMDSRPVRDLLSIMSEFSLDERREFLAFTTGSPRLPIGGFSALSPTLTIVRKDGGDGALFSSMTCVSYIKLPNYSSRDVVKERILFAIREGQGGFHLS